MKGVRCVDLVDRSMASWRNRAVNGFGGQKELKRRFKDGVDHNDFASRSSWPGPYV